MMNYYTVYFVKSNFVLSTVLSICFCLLNGVVHNLNSAMPYTKIELNLTIVSIKPSNSNLEVQLYKQFQETGVLALPYMSGDVSFRIVVTCVSNCPAEWTFDNMQYLYESSTSPRIIPTRIFGNLSQPFRSNLVLEGALTNNIRGPHASWLSGKYTCTSSMDKESERFFYAFFQSDPMKEFVHSTNVKLGVRPEVEDKWTGLACTTQTPNASILLWKARKKRIKSQIQWRHVPLSEAVKRDPSQGFVVAADYRISDYRCTSKRFNDTVITRIDVPIRSTKYFNYTELVPVLKFNRTANEYECCLRRFSPVGSYVNCNNLDECNFLSDRRIGRFLSHTRCTMIPDGYRDNWKNLTCCVYSRPSVPGLLRCINPFQIPLISTSMIVEDERSISQKPQIIRDIQTNEELSLLCKVSSFTFSNYLHWELQLWNGSTLSTQTYSTSDAKSGTITSRIQIPKNTEKVSCFAPLIGSAEWRNATMEFDEQLDLSPETSPRTIILTGSLTTLIFMVLVVAVAIKFSKKQPKVLTEEDIQKFLVGGIPSKSMDHTDIKLTPSVEELSGVDNIYEDILRLPYNKDFEFPRENFYYDKSSNKLGEGAFGVVYSGKLRVSVVEEFNVAIKMIIADVTREKLKSILAEIKIMSYIGSHVNVVNLLGANTRQLRQNKILMAVELCRCEDYITKNKTEFNRQPVHGYDLQVPHFSTRALVKWAGDIAHGMVFLSSKKVIHVDLATRNIFLTDSLIPKIGDFGLSRRLYTREIYLKKSEEYLPIYWMSLESLKTLTFSTKSDVWSYGVTLWEMFSLCQEPYKTPGDSLKPTWDQMVMFLSSGRRLLQPEHATSTIYAVMQQCWDEDPTVRPSFEVLRETLLNELDKLDSI